jgi:hypothetical protein
MAAGVLTTATSLNGPPLVLWLRGRGHSPAVFRATITVTLLALSVAGLVALLIGHDVRLGGGLVAAGLIGTGAGWAVGTNVFRRMHPNDHRRAVTALLVAAGTASVVAGLV